MPERPLKGDDPNAGTTPAEAPDVGSTDEDAAHLADASEEE